MSIFGIKKQKRNSLRNDPSVSDLRVLSKSLDMGGNKIVNLGNPSQSSDAVSRRFVFQKVQSIVDDYKLEDIETIKQILETEHENVEKITNDLEVNGQKIIELQRKIGTQIKNITEIYETLENKSDKTDDEIKELLRRNISHVVTQINDLRESIIKQEELRTKLIGMEKKLKDEYKLEINEKMYTLKRDIQNENNQKNNELLNLFLTRFSEYKSDLEKAVSQRGDIHDVAVVKLRNDVTKLEETINSMNNTVENIIPKQIDDLSETILTLVDDNKKNKKKISKLDKAVYEIPLFSLLNHRVQEVNVWSVSRGIPIEYEFKTDELTQAVKNTNLFALFNFEFSPIVNYLEYLKPEHKFDFSHGTPVVGFQAKKKGKYIFEVNLVATGNITGFNLYWTVLPEFPPGREFIEKDIKKEFTLELDSDMFVLIYPVANNKDDEFKFKIQADSYVNAIYSWKGVV